MHTLDHDKYKPLQKPVPGIRKTIFTQSSNGGPAFIPSLPTGMLAT